MLPYFKKSESLTQTPKTFLINRIDISDVHIHIIIMRKIRYIHSVIRDEKSHNLHIR
jgi:hypothetical protein